MELMVLTLRCRSLPVAQSPPNHRRFPDHESSSPVTGTPSPLANETQISIEVLTADGVRLRGLYADGSTTGPTRRPADLCFVICHGMTNATGQVSTRAAIDAFGRHGAVLALDFRGHGKSSGRSSVGRTEVWDVDAAVGYARARGHNRVAVIGFSMGGAVTLRHAGLSPSHWTALADNGGPADDPNPALVAELVEFDLQHQPDVVVSVSAPSRWFSRESMPMRRIQWLLEHPLGKLIGPRIGIRLGEPWSTVPLTPLELVGRIQAPLLIVHGALDHYFDPERARELHRAAPNSELWLISNMAHAESSISSDTIDRIASWVHSQPE